MSFVLRIKDALTGQPYSIREIDEADFWEGCNTWFGVPMSMPIKMKRRTDKDTAFWLLPTDPYITVDGRNIIIKRNVAKAKNTGSIKERWSQDDYAITIEGTLLTPDSDKYPKRDVIRLGELCEAAGPIDVESPMLLALGITAIAIEDFSFPYTQGAAVQDFRIKASSDKDWQLLIEENKNVP